MLYGYYSERFSLIARRKAKQNHESECNEEERRTSINKKVYLFVLLVSGGVYCEGKVPNHLKSPLDNSNGLF